MNKKEIVDAYLEKYYNEIITLQESGIIRWEELVPKILIQDYLKEVNTTFGLTGEYIRLRWRYLRKKNLDGILDRGQGAILNEGLKKKIENGDFDNKKPFVVSSTEPKLNYSYKENKDKGTAEINFTSDHTPSESEIIDWFKIDTKRFRINQIYHKTSFGGKYSITVSLLALKIGQQVELSDEFVKNLSKITPISPCPHNGQKGDKPKASLLIPKQDIHFNKFDIDGKNSIEDRFAQFTNILLTQLEKVRLTNTLEEINYIVGSDEFNSEWTQTTTKFTPQRNILTYQEAFEKITNFNIEIIKLLRYYSPKVNVIFLSGNHDEFAGWHLSHVLKTVFSKNGEISIDSSINNTKKLSYGSNLVMLNHGDAIKPKDLAAKFPIIAKEQWSKHSNYTVLCGDKHHEMSHDFNGTIFYQVPQLSNAKSNWDDKHGYITSKAEFLSFVFEEDGLSNILRKIII